jgi:hypothetical protein
VLQVAFLAESSLAKQLVTCVAHFMHVHLPQVLAVEYAGAAAHMLAPPVLPPESTRGAVEPLSTGVGVGMGLPESIGVGTGSSVPLPESRVVDPTPASRTLPVVPASRGVVGVIGTIGTIEPES